MNKLTNQTIFQCEYCTRISKSAAGMKTHELFCKKNPHTHSLCSTCKHCKKVVESMPPGSKCEFCDKCEKDWIENWTYEDCWKYDNVERACDAMQRVVRFICGVDGSKMYSPKIGRLSKEKREQIVSQCDKPMPNEIDKCEHYDVDFNR